MIILFYFLSQKTMTMGQWLVCIEELKNFKARQNSAVIYTSSFHTVKYWNVFSESAFYNKFYFCPLLVTYHETLNTP